MIEVASLTKRYGGKNGFLALEDISLTVADGSIFGLVGYNGAGKTTLLKTIAGIYHPSAGKVLINDDHYPPKPGELFIVADEPYFIPQATPQTMAALYKGYYPNWSDAVYARLLDIFGLSASARIEGFSKGMQRQAGIALGFASGASILLLDESFDGLDLSKRRLLKRLLRAYAHLRNATVMITSHNLRELEDIADHLGMIDGCHLVFCGAVDEIKGKHQYGSLEEIFLNQGSDDTANIDVEKVFA